jgi:hypothetical protein
MADAAADAAVQTGGGNKGGLIAALAAIAVFAVGYFGLKPTGVWLTAIGAVIAALCSVACVLWGVTMRYYTVTLQDAKKPKTAKDRKPYAELRAQLAAGGITTTLYERWLTAALARVDAFFGDGDAAAASRSLWARAFGLTHPAPLWTARSFDRCLLLALIYPIAMVIILWIVTGHPGPAGAALGLSQDVFWGRRALPLAAVFFFAWASCRKVFWANRSIRWFALVASLTLGSASIFASQQVIGATVVSFVLLVMNQTYRGVYASAVFSGTLGFAFIAASLVAYARFYLDGFDLAFLAVVVMAIILAAPSAQTLSRAQGMEGWFQLAIVTISLGLFLILPLALGARDEVMHDSVSGLLLFAFLTLVNAPFDWLSLGLTRALLRRGLELGGWWPYACAVVDAVLAVVLIAVLAATMLLSAQWFDDAAISTARHMRSSLKLPTDWLTPDLTASIQKWQRSDVGHILDVRALLDGIRHNPKSPEYFWVYATLFSTMIPSVVNLAIGGCSLLRGAPPLRRLLLRNMPETGAVARPDLVWMPLLLTAQLFGGVALALIVQAGLFFGVIGWLLPWVGFDLLDACRTLAAADLPGQAMHAVLGW